MSHVPFPTLGLDAKFADETAVLDRLISEAALSEDTRQTITRRAATLVERIRTEAAPTLMEHFLAEYGLSTKEGVALMCLAEAMLRVPDTFTIDALIEDKIVPSDWSRHLGTASSTLVNASTWALMLTGKVLEDAQPGIAGTLRGALKRLGEPVIRAAVKRAMTEMGRQFVLGETIEAALATAREAEAEGYTFSYDMLGEAARTADQAKRYAVDYAHAIEAIGKAAPAGPVVEAPGISVKLSALHPRYEVAHEAQVLRELVPVVQGLARAARRLNIGFHIDAEEQDRLVLSFKVIEAVLADADLAGWDGFGIVIQAYGKRAGAAIDAAYALAEAHDRKINIRLVKGAYWDTEMKLAQVAGHPGFPLFTTKPATDVAYICLAGKLFALGDRLFPQFATHNAHTVAAILELADGRPFELQRLHGMGERLHDIVLKDTGGHCRIYAPVGAHRDLLAYLVRRLLENGANSSFVHQIVDETVPAAEVAADPFAALPTARPPAALLEPVALFQPQRANSRGWDLSDDATLARLQPARKAPPNDAAPPDATPDDIARALDRAQVWAADPTARAEALRRAADLYEAHHDELFALLTQEAGKTLIDCVGELREAVDFLRYYAAEGASFDARPRGVITAISPWNFPLAIFTGQIAAALMAGNAVLAKPADQTPRIAARATALLHEAGVPETALQLLPGPGATVGAALTSDPRVKGIVFTGSTATARIIAKSAARHLAPGMPLIAETGGINAMVVDSTALPEQAVRDIIASAFQSAGQRCSALRCLYVQEDSADDVIAMVKGAMDALVTGDPAELATDVGPVIDDAAAAQITGYLDDHRSHILHQAKAPDGPRFVPPTLIGVDGISDIPREVFGPVLHVATFEGDALKQVIDEINATGYGLTFALHTRIDTRVQNVTEALSVGNVYVNRNQIGAVVGSQPFGGEGLSGTGPKAGGPLYLPRFYSEPPKTRPDASQLLPGPTGEMNRLSLSPRAPVLCLGPGVEQQRQQAQHVTALGGQANIRALAPDALETIPDLSAVLWWGDDPTGRRIAKALARRDGPLIPLITGQPDGGHVLHERHLSVDTTASGGNAALLAG